MASESSSIQREHLLDPLPDNSSSQQESLLDTLADDVYCYTVSSIVNNVQGCRMLKTILAMLFTFVLQIGLLVLLWRGVVQGSATGVTNGMSETDKLWRQVGQVQRQITRLNQHTKANESSSPDALDYSEAWKTGTSCGETISYQALTKCMGGSLEKDACKEFSGLESSQRAYATGLLVSPKFIIMNKAGIEPASADDPNACMQTIMPPVPPTLRSDPAFVSVPIFFALAIYVHEEIAKAVWLGYVSAAYAGILPTFFATHQSRAVPVYSSQKYTSFWTIVMLLAPVMQMFTCLMVLASSMALAFICETQEKVVAIILSNMALTFILDIDNKVAAIFRVQGKCAAATGSGTRSPPTQQNGEAGGDTSGNRASTNGASSNFWGHLYMAVLGFLVLAETVCLSPVIVWVAYYSRSTTDAFLKQNADTVWTRVATFAASDVLRPKAMDAVGKAKVLGGEYQHSLINLAAAFNVTDVEPKFIAWRRSSQGMQVFAPVYICVVALFVFLLYGKILPTAAAKQRWSHVLVVLQIGLAVAPFVLGIYAVPAVIGVTVAWFLAAVGMFVLWPVLHPPMAGDSGSSSVGSGGYPASPASLPVQAPLTPIHSV